jgi:hypothetical protein
MNVNKFIRFYEVKRNDLTLAEAIEYLEVTPAQFNRLRKLELISPIEGGEEGSTKKLYFLHDDVVNLWNEMLEFDKNL